MPNGKKNGNGNAKYMGEQYKKYVTGPSEGMASFHASEATAVAKRDVPPPQDWAYGNVPKSPSKKFKKANPRLFTNKSHSSLDM
jgi:hypothetical protein